MNSAHAVVDRFDGTYSEDAVQLWARQLRARLEAPRVTLGLVFISPRLSEHAPSLLEILRVHAEIPMLAGCSSPGLIAEHQEYEEADGMVCSLLHLPDAELTAARIQQEQVDEASSPAYWHLETGVGPDTCKGWLVFADPFHLNVEGWLRSWNEAYPGTPILGGLASGDFNTTRTQVYLNGEVFEQGGVAIAIGGRVRLESVISQGCTPIGETWTVTRAEKNLIHEIGNRPAYEVLVDTFNQLSPQDQQKTRGNLFVGLVINEYLEDFRRGDFLVRNVIGADPRSGTLAVGAVPRPGQTLQFQRRDPSAATEDMSELLRSARRKLLGETIYGGCLCSCNGRGQRLFEIASHDAQLVQAILGPLPLVGFFCNGEIGPVGDRNFLHGYTASLALFIKD